MRVRGTAQFIYCTVAKRCASYGFTSLEPVPESRQPTRLARRERLGDTRCTKVCETARVEREIFANVMNKSLRKIPTGTRTPRSYDTASRSPKPIALPAHQTHAMGLCPRLRSELGMGDPHSRHRVRLCVDLMTAWLLTIGPARPEQVAGRCSASESAPLQKPGHPRPYRCGFAPYNLHARHLRTPPPSLTSSSPVASTPAARPSTTHQTCGQPLRAWQGQRLGSPAL